MAKSTWPVALATFLLASVVTYGGITYFAPQWAMGDIATHGITAGIVGLFLAFLTAMLRQPRKVIDRSKIPPYPRMPAMPERTAAKSAEPRESFPLPEGCVATYRSDTANGDTRVHVTVVGLTGAQFKKKGGLRTKLEAIKGIKWSHPSNDSQSKTITMTGVVGNQTTNLLVDLEKLVVPAP